MSDGRSDQEGWITLEIPGSGLRVRYPAVAESGAPIEVDGLRVHARSTGTAEIYFEVSKQQGVTAQEQYERERAGLESAPSPPSISALAPVTFAGHAAMRFTATWPDRERVFTLIQNDGVLYRTVHDPRSAINEEIVETLELLDVRPTH